MLPATSFFQLGWGSGTQASLRLLATPACETKLSWYSKKQPLNAKSAYNDVPRTTAVQTDTELTRLLQRGLRLLAPVPLRSRDL